VLLWQCEGELLRVNVGLALPEGQKEAEGEREGDSEGDSVALWVPESEGEGLAQGEGVSVAHWLAVTLSVPAAPLMATVLAGMPLALLVGAAGLQMPGAQIADIFMYSQHRDGGIMRDLRNLLFADADSALANSIVPDGRVNIPDEVRRYKSLTLAGRVGWEPPYLHDRKLLDRLHRITAPALLIWGEQDRFVPLANGRAYEANLPRAALKVLPGVGHSAILEAPEQCMALIAPFLSTGALP
jgi:pimeloyl-ACP methyl ester carboxylesterase